MQGPTAGGQAQRGPTAGGPPLHARPSSAEQSSQGANFERLAVTEDGEPGQERSADLTDADFRDADLSNAQLSTVTGLRAEMLAGAVLTNAKLPDDIKTFDQLKHVEETSRNASTVFFGLLAASLYSWLTIATTTDVALITGTASSPLPIINTNIALSGFYLAAPLILIAVYFYFHLTYSGCGATWRASRPCSRTAKRSIAKHTRGS